MHGGDNRRTSDTRQETGEREPWDDGAPPNFGEDGPAGLRRDRRGGKTGSKTGGGKLPWLFWPVSKPILNRADLPDLENVSFKVWVAVFMRAHVNGRKGAWIRLTYEQIAAVAKISLRTAKRAVADLIAAGLLELRPGRGHHAPNQYRLALDNTSKAEKSNSATRGTPSPSKSATGGTTRARTLLTVDEGHAGWEVSTEGSAPSVLGTDPAERGVASHSENLGNKGSRLCGAYECYSENECARLDPACPFRKRG
jgi:hypothetical protein